MYYLSDYNSISRKKFEQKFENLVIVIVSIAMIINFVYLIKDIHALSYLLYLYLGF